MSISVTNLRDEPAQHGGVQQVVLRLLKPGPMSRQVLGQPLLKLEPFLPPLGPLSPFQKPPCGPKARAAPPTVWPLQRGPPVPRAQGSGSDPHQLPRDVQVEGTSLLQQQEGGVKQVLGEAHCRHGAIGTHVRGQHKVRGLRGQDDGFAQEQEDGLRGRWVARGRKAAGSQ